MTKYRQVDYRYLWIPVVCFLVSVSAVGREGLYRNWVHYVLGVQHTNGSAKGYLVERVATGVSAASALLLILLLAAFTWRRAWYLTFMGVFPAVMLLGQPVAYAIALLWGCLNRVDPAQADSLMRDNALEDRAFQIALCSSVAVATCFWVGGVVWWLRSRRSNSAQSRASMLKSDGAVADALGDGRDAEALAN